MKIAISPNESGDFQAQGSLVPDYTEAGISRALISKKMLHRVLIGCTLRLTFYSHRKYIDQRALNNVMRRNGRKTSLKTIHR